MLSAPAYRSSLPQPGQYERGSMLDPPTQNPKPKWWFPKISGTILGVPIIRTLVFWGFPLFWETTKWLRPPMMVGSAYLDGTAKGQPTGHRPPAASQGPGAFQGPQQCHPSLLRHLSAFLRPYTDPFIAPGNTPKQGP